MRQSPVVPAQRWAFKMPYLVLEHPASNSSMRVKVMSGSSSACLRSRAPMQRSSSFASPVAAGSTSGSSAVCAKPARQGASCARLFNARSEWKKSRPQPWARSNSAFPHEDEHPVCAAFNGCQVSRIDRAPQSCVQAASTVDAEHGEPGIRWHAWEQS